MKKYLLVLTLIPLLLKSQTINTICGGYLAIGDSAKAIGMVPQNSVVDKSGNIYIADYGKHVIRKLSKTGVYSIVAGTGISGFSGDSSQAVSAQISNAYTLTLDNKGNLYFSDNFYQRVRKVDVNGIITTIAGNGAYAFSGDGGLATAASITGITGIAVDKKGNIYLADLGNNRVRRIDTDGIITTVAGSATQGTGGDGGPATAAQLALPIGVTIDSIGELFISDVGADNVRKVDTNGIITTIAGSTNIQHGFGGDGGLATSAIFNNIVGSVAVDGEGNIYIPDGNNNRIRRIDKNGIINTIIGNGIKANTGDGGLATSAAINSPSGVNVYPSGEIYITTQNNIRRVDANNIIHTVAGNGSAGFNGDGILATKSQLYEPNKIALDKDGNIFLLDDGDFRVRKIDKKQIITTIAGNGMQGYVGEGSSATSAEFGEFMNGITIDKTGNIYIADFANQRIRKINKLGIINTIVGNGTRGFSGDGGLAINAEINDPSGIAIDDTGNIYIADRENHRIRKINTNGIINTIAGNGTSGFSGDGSIATSAELNSPSGLTIDRSGNILIVDFRNNRIRKLSTNGIITTIAGNGNYAFSGDGGNAINAGLSAQAVAMDSSGNILIADATNHRIRKVDNNGIITTIAGGGSIYGDNGNVLAADLPGLTSLAVDNSGYIYLTDFTNHRIRKITNGVLATSLLNFSASLNNNNVNLNWQTVSEVNTNYFNIQRSSDNRHFNTISKVTATGNSASTKYVYSDLNVAALHEDKLYYRLEEVDRDGKSNYSGVQFISLTKNKSLFTISPNPAKDYINISSSDNIINAQIIIRGINGRTLYSTKHNFTSGEQIKISTLQFPQQILLVTINANDSEQHFKVMKE